MKNAKYIVTLIVLTISLLANWYFYSQLKQTDSLLATFQQDKQIIKEQYELKRQETLRIQENFNALKHPDNQLFFLKGTPQTPSATTVLYLNQTTQKLYIDANGLPIPSDGLQYQLWAVMEAGQPYKSLGVFNHQPDKDNFFQLKYINNTTTFAISLEKPTGSEQPTEGRVYAKT